MVKISKNKRQLSSNSTKQKKTEKIGYPKTKELGGNLAYWALGVAVLNFILSYLLYSGNTTIKLPVYNIIHSLILFAAIYFSTYKNVKELVKYLFFSILVLGITIYLPFFKDTESELIASFQIYLVYASLPLGVLGIICIWQNKELLTKNEKHEFDKDKGFKIRLLSLGTPTILTFLAITILVSGALFYKLDAFDFWSDEKQTTQAAVGYYKTGDYLQWNFITDEAITTKKYGRAQPHVWLVAQSYKLFGVSEWSSRFVSAVSGILFIVFGFYVALFFTKSRLAALLFAITVAFGYEFLHLFRWARMYAILIPYTFIVLYILYKAIIGTNRFTIVNKGFTSFLNEYLNFNFIYLLVLFPLLYLGFKIHPNFLAILPPAVLFIIYLAIIKKEKKYYSAIGIMVVLFILIYFFFPKFIQAGRMSFFELNNTYYLNGFFEQPFNVFAGVTLFLTGFGVMIYSKDTKKKSRLVYLYLMVIVLFVLFTYVADYPQSFRYISHLSPFSILVLVAIYSSLFVVFSRPWQIILLSALLIGNVGSQFYERFSDLYIEHPIYNAKHDIAFQTIEDKHKNGEAIFLQFGTPYYLDDVDKSTQLINMSRNKRYSFQTFLKDINNYEAGWISWSIFNQYHVDDDIVSYCNLYFKKYHGFGIDNTNKDVFYYQKQDIVSDSIYRFDMNFPHANLKLDRPNTISFLCGINDNTDGFPVLINSDDVDPIRFLTYQNGQYGVKYNDVDSILFTIPIDEKLHLFILEQRGNQKGDTVKITIDNNAPVTKVLSKNGEIFAKFEINRQFNGQADDIRIYDFLLNAGQKSVLANSKLSRKNKKLKAGKESFEPLFYWTKN